MCICICIFRGSDEAIDKYLDIEIGIDIDLGTGKKRYRSLIRFVDQRNSLNMTPCS